MKVALFFVFKHKGRPMGYEYQLLSKLRNLLVLN